ncbi:MAG: hypothetical protein ABEJ87_03590 [Candidatus Nanohalobium sp.]
MDTWEKLPFQQPEGLKKDLFYLCVTLLLVGATVAVSNYTSPDKPVNVGLVEVHSECVGINVGFCLGIQKRAHTTYNYDDYKKAKPGTPNYYRRVESELMIRAYETCNKDVHGMEWTSKVTYKNKTAAQWGKNDNIQLLPCEQTFYRPLK